MSYSEAFYILIKYLCSVVFYLYIAAFVNVSGYFFTESLQSETEIGRIILVVRIGLVVPQTGGQGDFGRIEK